MNSQDCIVAISIKSIYESLLPTERLIANYIIKNLNVVVGLSIKQLAQNASTSCSSVTRFIKKLGYQSYRQFQLTLARDVVADVKHIHRDIDPNDGTRSIISKVCNANARASANTAKILDPEKLEEVARAILTAKRVFLFADGPAAAVAIDLYNKLLRLGIVSAFNADRRFQIILTSLLNQEDLVIGFSFWGTSKAAVNALKTSHQKGAFTVAITNQANSPITQYANIALLGASENCSSVTGTLLARIAQMCVVDSLFMLLVNRSGVDGLQNIEQTQKAIVADTYSD